MEKYQATNGKWYGGDVPINNHHSKQEREALIIERGDQCEICGVLGPNTKQGILHVDHDHLTGTVRGLLCNSCNVSIAMGRTKKNADWYQAAADYLRRCEGDETLLAPP